MNPFPFRQSAQNADLNRTIRAVTEAIGGEGDTHGGGATSPKRNGASNKKRRVPAPVVPAPTTPRVSEPLKISESHTRKELEGLSITRLRELKKKYERLVQQGDRDAARELADIRGLLRAKGAGVVLDEARGGGVERVCKSVEGDLKSIRIAAKRGDGEAVQEYAAQAVSSLSALESGEITEARKGLGKTKYGKALKKLGDAAEAIKANPPKPPVNPFKKVDEACWTGYTARGLKKKGDRMVPDCVKEETPCERAALARLKKANTEDLKDKPGAAGEKAHKRLHTTIGKILKQ